MSSLDSIRLQLELGRPVRAMRELTSFAHEHCRFRESSVGPSVAGMLPAHSELEGEYVDIATLVFAAMLDLDDERSALEVLALIPEEYRPVDTIAGLPELDVAERAWLERVSAGVEIGGVA